MADRGGKKLTAAWTSPDLNAAVASVANASGLSKSDLVRAALVAHLLAEPKRDAR